mgnify:CR=1 FL=1
MEKPNHLVEAQQFDSYALYSLFNHADDIRKNLSSYRGRLDGKILATLFYQPSTRTRLSFEGAMLGLGGTVISTENAKDFSSAAKGETLEDTIRVVSGYADAIVLRHYEEGAARKASEVSSVPIINAGDGKGQHPTQALLDVDTIYREVGRLDNLKIAMVGDLVNGRTVHSLCYLLGKFKNNEIIFLSPSDLGITNNIKEYLKRHEVSFSESVDLDAVLPQVDIVYMTRIQKNEMTFEDYEKAKGQFIINEKNLKLLRLDARLLHPLPHVEEISLSIETEQNDSRVAYFRQAQNGLFIRMAILDDILGPNSDKE